MCRLFSRLSQKTRFSLLIGAPETTPLLACVSLLPLLGEKERRLDAPHQETLGMVIGIPMSGQTTVTIKASTTMRSRLAIRP